MCCYASLGLSNGANWVNLTKGDWIKGNLEWRKYLTKSRVRLGIFTDFRHLTLMHLNGVGDQNGQGSCLILMRTHTGRITTGSKWKRVLKRNSMYLLAEGGDKMSPWQKILWHCFRSMRSIKAYSHQAKAKHLWCMLGILLIFATCSVIFFAFAVAFAWWEWARKRRVSLDSVNLEKLIKSLTHE